MKRMIILALFLILCVGGFADWVEVDNLVSVVPAEYVERVIENVIIDDIFYRMLQLERGVEVGERFMLLGLTTSLPQVLTNEGWAFTIDLNIDQRRSGDGPYVRSKKVLLLLQTQPTEVRKSYNDPMYSDRPIFVFGRYVGAREISGQLIPVFIVERLLVLKTVLDVQSFDFDDQLMPADQDLLTHFGG